LSSEVNHLGREENQESNTLSRTSFLPWPDKLAHSSSIQSVSALRSQLGNCLLDTRQQCATKASSTVALTSLWC